MNLEDLGRLQVYLLTYIVASIVLTFGILPALVTSLTPLNYRAVVGPIRGVLLTAFATGNLLIVLPILTQRGMEVLREAELTSMESDSAVEVIVPISFTFPTIGMLLSLSFIPFAAWYVGSSYDGRAISKLYCVRCSEHVWEGHGGHSVLTRLVAPSCRCV